MEIGSPAKGLTPPTGAPAQSTPIVNYSVSPSTPLSQSPIQNTSLSPTALLSQTPTSFTSVSSTSNDCVQPHPSPKVKITLFTDDNEKSGQDSKEVTDNTDKVYNYILLCACVIR